MKLGLDHFIKRRLGLEPRVVRFVGLFLVLVLILTFLLNLTWTRQYLVDPYTGFLARISAAILRVLGTEVQVHGTTLGKGTFVVEIRRGCDGLEATLLLVSACLAYPASWWGRVLGSLWGYGLIFVLNLGRIVGLALIGFSDAAQSFDFFHIYVSQFAVIAFTMVYWVFWAGRQRAVNA